MFSHIYHATSTDATYMVLLLLTGHDACTSSFNLVLFLCGRGASNSAGNVEGMSPISTSSLVSAISVSSSIRVPIHFEEDSMVRTSTESFCHHSSYIFSFNYRNIQFCSSFSFCCQSSQILYPLYRVCCCYILTWLFFLVIWFYLIFPPNWIRGTLALLLFFYSPQLCRCLLFFLDLNTPQKCRCFNFLLYWNTMQKYRSLVYFRLTSKLLPSLVSLS